MSLMKKTLITFLLIASDCQAVRHQRSKRFKHDIISGTMRDIASKEPQIAVLQHKLNKIQDLKPRLDGAKTDIDSLLAPPVRHEDSSIKEMARKALDNLNKQQTHDDEVPRLARKALDNLYGKEQPADDIKTLAKKALNKLNGGDSGAQDNEIASLAKKALNNPAIHNPSPELQDLAKRALQNVSANPPASGGSDLQDLAKKALSKMEGGASSGGDDLQSLAKKALQKIEGSSGGDDIQTLAKKALKKLDGGGSADGDDIQTLAKAALGNLNQASLVQQDTDFLGKDGIVIKTTPAAIADLRGKALDQFVKQTNDFAQEALGDVDATSRRKAQQFIQDSEHVKAIREAKMHSDLTNKVSEQVEQNKPKITWQQEIQSQKTNMLEEIAGEKRFQNEWSNYSNWLPTSYTVESNV